VRLQGEISGDNFTLTRVLLSLQTASAELGLLDLPRRVGFISCPFSPYNLAFPHPFPLLRSGIFAFLSCSLVFLPSRWMMHLPFCPTLPQTFLERAMSAHITALLCSHKSLLACSLVWKWSPAPIFSGRQVFPGRILIVRYDLPGRAPGLLGNCPPRHPRFRWVTCLPSFSFLLLTPTFLFFHVDCCLRPPVAFFGCLTCGPSLPFSSGSTFFVWKFLRLIQVFLLFSPSSATRLSPPPPFILYSCRGTFLSFFVSV